MSLVVNEDSKIPRTVIDEPTTAKDYTFGKSIVFDNDNNLLITTYDRGQYGSTHDIIVFKKDSNNTWVHKTEINVGKADKRKNQLSLNGNYLAVGVPTFKESSGGSTKDLGMVKIFETTDNGDSWSEKITINPTGEDSGDAGQKFKYFGAQVILEGNTLMVTAYLENESPQNGSENSHGAVYFYSTSNNWSTVTLDNKFFGDWDGTYGNRLGLSAGLSGNYAIVRDWAYKLYFYKKDSNGNWSLKQSFDHSGDGANHGGTQTYSISINGNYALIGAQATGTAPSPWYRGQAFMYKTEDSGETWSLKQTFTLPEALRNDWDEFGKQVKLVTEGNVDYAFISAEGYDYDNPNDIKHTGLVNIYKKGNTNETWSLITQLMPTNNEANYYLGKSIAVDGAILAASGANDIVFYEYVAWELTTSVDLTVNGTDITIDFDDAGSGSIYKIERSDDNGETYTSIITDDCLPTGNVDVNIVNSNGNKYVFNSNTYDSSIKYNLGPNNTYILRNIPSNHPIAILNNGKTDKISYSVVDDVNSPIVIKVSGGSTSESNGDYYTFKDSNNNTINIGNGNFRFMRGKTYKFEADGIEGSHPFKIYMSGEFQNDNNSSSGGISGSSGSITITIPSNHSTSAGDLYYQCSVHSGMKKNLLLLYQSVSGTTNDASYDFFYGDVTVTVSDDFENASVYCYYHVIWAEKIYSI